MLKKLLKYEWKGSYKVVLLLNLYVIVTTLIGIASLAMGVWDFNSEGISSLGALLFILYIVSISFVSTIVCIYIAVRYYRRMYMDEGYLMHTLPVNKHHLLMSQTIVGTIHSVFTSIVLLVCIFGLMYFLYMFLDAHTRELLQINMDDTFFQEAAQAFAHNRIFKIVLIAVYLILSNICSILMSFSAASLGQLFRKHKVMASIVCYIGLYMVLQTVCSFGTLPFTGLTLFSNITLTQILGVFLFIETVIVIVLGIAFYLINYYLLNKKLNLD